MEEFINLLNQLVQVEVRAERIRKSLSNRKNFDISKAFKALCKDGKDRIEKKNIYDFLE
jgi:Ca2+-binding EF-hand superfamily protein